MAAPTRSPKGCAEEFGAKRCRDTPLAESVFVGAGVGAAMGGLRPIVELMTINFSLVAIDQIINNAAKVHYMFGGQFSCADGHPHPCRLGAVVGDALADL